MLFSSSLPAEEIKSRAALALDALGQLVDLRGGWGEGPITASAEYDAARSLGVSLLPELAARLAGSAPESQKYLYGILFVSISHCAPFPYSLT